MNKFKIKIKKIEILNNIINIISYENIIFYSKINKGSINFKIYNNKYNEIGLDNLNENDIIVIYGTINDNENNNILIEKIKTNNKYMFISESSNEDIFDYND